MITIRNAESSDATLMYQAQKQLAEQPGLLAPRPHELAEAEFRKKIESFSRIPNAKYIVAESGRELLGHAMLDPMGLESVQHVSRLTIVVHPSVKEKNLEEKRIGEAMLSHLIEWAKTAPIVEKIELNVRATNQRAIQLYERMGFVVEGRLVKRFKCADGAYLDDLVMALFVKNPPR